MNIIRDCADYWNKFGWYKPKYSPEVAKTSKWHIMQSTNWTPPEPRDTIQRLFDSDKTYVLSKFNIFKEFPDLVLVWNTASESIVSISQDEEKELHSFLANQPGERASIFIRSLYDLGIIVEQGEDEFLKFDYIRKRSITNDDSIKSFIIIPTTRCNARCFYCFAGEDTKTQKTMGPETISDVVSFIVSQLRPNDEIIYRWFGGEPLLADDIIDEIVKRVHKLAPHNDYHSIITTNSSLMSNELLDRAVELWHLKKVQIPIDGYREQHDKRKKYINEEGNQYEHIVSLIGKLLDKGVYTTCRFNMDMGNINDLRSVLKDLKKYANNKHFYFQPIPLHTPKNTKNLNNYVGKDNYHSFYRSIYAILFEEGYLMDINRLLPRREQSVCTAMLNNYFLINADGYLFRCDQELHCRENSVGHCREGVIHNANLRRWLDDSLAEECIRCEFLPICQGGCKFYRMRNDPNLSPCVEHKFIFDILMEIVYRLYAFR